MNTTPARTYLGRQLQLARKRTGLTQEQVADLLPKCDATQVSLWETGHRVPEAARLHHLAKLYKTDPGRLLFMAAKDLAEENRKK